MARGVAYLVFLLPVVISVPIASFVMMDILDEPDRELDMWRIGDGQGHVSSSSIDFVELYGTYSTSDPITIGAVITDPSFDCGDVYITIYDNYDNPVSQNAFFDQCFSTNQSIVPIGDKFSKVLDTSGSYSVVLEILDKEQKQTDSASVEITVL